MRMWNMFIDTILELVLPRARDVAKFDTLPVQAFAEHMHATVYHKEAGCHAPLRYTSPLVRSCIHAAKYHAHTRAAELLGEILTPHVADLLAEQLMFGLYEKPLIIPVPLHRQRERERGYNQAERIARAVAMHTSLSPLACRTDMLARVRDTHAQAKLKKKDRLHNMDGAFTVLYPELVRDADIVLVDDVVTTGATLRAARKALEEAGARTVLCIAAAH